MKSTCLQGREFPGFFPECRRLLGVFDLTATPSPSVKSSVRNGENQLHLSLERGRGYTPWVQCFAIWIPDEMRGKAAVDWFERIYRRFQEELGRIRIGCLPAKANRICSSGTGGKVRRNSYSGRRRSFGRGFVSG